MSHRNLLHESVEGVLRRIHRRRLLCGVLEGDWLVASSDLGMRREGGEGGIPVEFEEAGGHFCGV